MIKNYKTGDTLFKKDFDDILDKLKKIEVTNTLEENKTVFFNKNVQISRKEFKKQYPTNKIVHDLSKADYYIDNDHTTYPYFYFGYNTKINLDTHWRSANNLKELNLCIDLINNVKVEFIYASSIKFKSSNSDLPDEMVDRIIQMLKSSDQETFQLGWTILFEYDYELYKDKFLAIISQANHWSFYKRKKTRVIEQKLKTLKTFYPNKNF